MDAEQLTYWYDLCGAELGLYARHILKSYGSEDIVHDVFIKLMAQRTPPENVRAWLFTAVRNASITKLRKIKRRQKLREKLMNEKPWFETSQVDNVDSAELQKALEQLDEEQREVVLLRIWGQLTLKQIAEMIGCSTTTVYMRFDQSIRAMQKIMCIDNYV